MQSHADTFRRWPISAAVPIDNQTPGTQFAVKQIGLTSMVGPERRHWAGVAKPPPLPPLSHGRNGWR